MLRGAFVAIFLDSLLLIGPFKSLGAGEATQPFRAKIFNAEEAWQENIARLIWQ